MLAAKLKLDRYTFSGLIEACSKAGKVCRIPPLFMRLR